MIIDKKGKITFYKSKHEHERLTKTRIKKNFKRIGETHSWNGGTLIAVSREFAKTEQKKALEKK